MRPSLPKPALIQQFLRRLRLSRSAILPVTPLDPRYAAGQCHVNVAHRVREAGGQVVPGWLLRPGMINEAAYHAVWQPPGGTALVDPTPRAGDEALLVFLPDPARRIAPSVVPGCDLLLWADRILGLQDMPAVFQGRPSAERVDIAFDAAAHHALRQLGLTPAEAVAIGHRPG